MRFHAHPAHTHVRTHAVALSAARTHVRAWTLSFCARFAGRASLPPASAFRSSSPPLRPGESPRAWLARPGLSAPAGPLVLSVWEESGRRGAQRAQRRSGSVGSWGRRAGLGPAPCLFSPRPLNARLRRKDYPRRIMPGVNTRANKSACTTPPTPLGPRPRAGGETALLAANYK